MPSRQFAPLPALPRNAAATPTSLPRMVCVPAVLGRFLHSLNKFCHEEYGMRYEVSDYWVYDFAKVGAPPAPARRRDAFLGAAPPKDGCCHPTPWSVLAFLGAAPPRPAPLPCERSSRRRLRRCYNRLQRGVRAGVAPATKYPAPSFPGHRPSRVLPLCCPADLGVCAG